MGIQIRAPVWPSNLLKIRLNSGKAIFSTVGLEKRCSRCCDYWPADSEFFYTVPSKADGLNDWCKACCNENRRKLN
jgi:hypothetical protein